MKLARAERVFRSARFGAHRRNEFAAHGLGVVGNRERPASQIALHFVAAFLEQDVVLRFGFDAFGQDRNVETAAEADDRVNDRDRLLIGTEIGDEGAVDLDLVERERAQIRQRRITFAESSSAIRTPSDLRRRRIDTAREKSSIKTPSVISSSSRFGASPVSRRMECTSRGRSP